MAHDFKNFPELTNPQMVFYYWESPHKQITEDFTGKVVAVHDGDTVKLRTDFRDFDFPLRFANIAAPELKENGGKESQAWLENEILNQEVEVFINKLNRVEKHGRLLGLVNFMGMDMGESSILAGHSVEWDKRGTGRIKSDIIDEEKIWKEGEF